MNGPITLLADERTSGKERLVVRWLATDEGAHRLDVAVERRKGDGWERAYGISVSPGEVLRLHDAIGAACWHAMRVRR